MSKDYPPEFIEALAYDTALQEYELYGVCEYCEQKKKLTMGACDVCINNMGESY